MHDEMYSDGIEEITITGSVVRVDLISLSPTERDANNHPKKVFRPETNLLGRSFRELSGGYAERAPGVSRCRSCCTWKTAAAGR